MKWTRLKVLKHTEKMPISLSPEICRLSVCCLFNPSTLKLKRERTCPRLLMLSRGTHVMTEFYFPITLPSFWGSWLHTQMIRSRKDKTLILSTHALFPHLIEVGRVPCAILISLPVLPFSFERFKVQAVSKAYKSDIEILLG